MSHLPSPRAPDRICAVEGPNLLEKSTVGHSKPPAIDQEYWTRRNGDAATRENDFFLPISVSPHHPIRSSTHCSIVPTFHGSFIWALRRLEISRWRLFLRRASFREGRP